VARDVASTSLIEHVAETGFRSSVIATYSCYFSFYEDVVLRRLMTAGCIHNVLMVDATRCAEAFARRTCADVFRNAAPRGAPILDWFRGKKFAVVLPSSPDPLCGSKHHRRRSPLYRWALRSVGRAFPGHPGSGHRLDNNRWLGRL
jgi:hypothetical protein